MFAFVPLAKASHMDKSRLRVGMNPPEGMTHRHVDKEAWANQGQLLQQPITVDDPDSLAQFKSTHSLSFLRMLGGKWLEFLTAFHFQNTISWSPTMYQAWLESFYMCYTIHTVVL